MKVRDHLTSTKRTAIVGKSLRTQNGRGEPCVSSRGSGGDSFTSEEPTGWGWIRRRIGAGRAVGRQDGNGFNVGPGLDAGLNIGIGFGDHGCSSIQLGVKSRRFGTMITARVTIQMAHVMIEMN